MGRTFGENAAKDSYQLLNFAIGLHDALGIDVPEADYARLATLNGCLAYLADKLGPPNAGEIPPRPN